MTDAQYDNWLADLSAPRIVLCELDYAGSTEYVSSHPYISKPTDSAANRIYDDLLIEAVDIETRIDGLISFGDITLIDDGEITHWVSRAWQGHSIRLYLGGPDWSRDDFRLHARGINGGITSARRGEITFAMDDQSTVLDEPIDTGELPDDGGPVPLALGSVYNAPAYRTSDGTQYEYKASFLPCVSLTPKEGGSTTLTVSNYASEGRFVLDAPVSLDLTVDIEEQHSTPHLIAEWVAGQYGITVGDINMPDYTVGLYYNSEVTGRQVLDDLCAGLGAYWYLNRLNELVMRQHTVPTTADITLFDDDIEYDQIGLSETEPPWSSLTLRWGRNYSALRTVAGVIEDNEPTEAARLKREWSESKATQDVDDYPLAEDATRDSCIANAADATTERNRLLALKAVRRDVYSINAFMPVVEVGQAIAVEHPRMQGRIGRLLAVGRSPTRSTTSLEVWL
ncbi:hypothetical protein [Vreelandella maris]|uniref:Uncharacterized protein n=1 Tax=Vreelandella maris TaxID=2729617 RepID=A0A7Y6RFW7_9GAMM|nr:hypothetical protein [Halomonas maris]NVF16222.1 hypothetical protein [Halomonas maris]|tara:strand:+ start:10175 stop:11533 length:1359 start_codon:yes stop_codon:yes gene_type:complete